MTGSVSNSIHRGLAEAVAYAKGDAERNDFDDGGGVSTTSSDLPK